MFMIGQEPIFLGKARESLIGAESEFLNERYNYSVNLAYYACFQAAIAALQKAGIQARGDDWGHDYVQSQFNGMLINRRHLYPTKLRNILVRNYALRVRADYAEDVVSRTDTERGVRRARLFVTTIVEGDEPG
jgi:uncharacterized protein (UPF0332 family)